MATAETHREQMGEVKRTWPQVQGLIYQMLERYDEELVELEIRMERLDDSLSLSEATSGRLKKKYIGRMMELMERYYTMWVAHDLLFGLYFEPRSLEERGFELKDKKNLENYKEMRCECGNQREL